MTEAFRGTVRAVVLKSPYHRLGEGVQEMIIERRGQIPWINRCNREAFGCSNSFG